MGKKDIAVNMIKEKLAHDSFYTYKEIAEITGYHPKYLLKLKKEILDGTVSLQHGNKNRKPINTISDEEKEKIISLYKRSNVSIRKFCKFYGRRSYSCVYHIIKDYENNLRKEEEYEKNN